MPEHCPECSATSIMLCECAMPSRKRPEVCKWCGAKYEHLGTVSGQSSGSMWNLIYYYSCGESWSQRDDSWSGDSGDVDDASRRCLARQLSQAQAENERLSAQNQWLKSSISGALIVEGPNGIVTRMAAVEKLYMMQDAAAREEKDSA